MTLSHDFYVVWVCVINNTLFQILTFLSIWEDIELKFAIIGSIVKAEGPPHAKKYVCLVRIENVDGGLSMEGEEKSKVKEAKNSAASCIIRALLESNPT